MIKAFIKKIVNTAGYNIIKSPKKLTATATPTGNSMQSGLLRAKIRNNNFRTIVDVGAAAGKWTEKTLQIWPQADYLLIEPLVERKNELEALKSRHNNIQIMQVVLGNSSGKLTFSVASDLDGSGVYGKNAANTTSREVDMTTLDNLIKKYNKKGPYLIKLDTHGFEIPIFEGAQKTLKNTELIIVEAYGFYVSPYAVLFYDLCNYLDKIGFRPLDIVDIVNRKKDGAFWQCDIFFVPKTSSVFQDNLYA